MREFIASDVTAELQRGSEANKLVKPGEKFLTQDQVRHLLKFFNVDEIQALTGTGGLTSAEAIRQFAGKSEEFLRQVKDLTTRFGQPVAQIAKAFEGLGKARTTDAEVMSVLNGSTSKADIAALGALLGTMAAGGAHGTDAAEFIGRVSRIRAVDGVKFDLAELQSAFKSGDAILDHGPLQKGEFLNDMVGGTRAILGEGRIDVGTGDNMPAKLRDLPGIDFVIVRTDGGFRLILGLEHSGLSGGRASVFAAGQLKFNKQGIVTEVNNGSGHYLPSEANLDRAVQFLYDHNNLSTQRPVKVRYIK